MDSRLQFTDSSKLQRELQKPEGTWKLQALESYVPGPMETTEHTAKLL
jgi:hypothetical protein